MHQPRKWWIGLPVLGGLAYLATQSLTPRLEAELRTRVAARLSLAPEQIHVSGRDVLVSGAIASQTALAALRGEAGLRKAIVEAAPATPAPSTHRAYIFAATLGGSLVALDGELPDEALRTQAVARAARAGAGLAVSDGTRTNAAAPEGDYAAAVAVALDALGRLRAGKVSLADNALSIEGEGRENVRAETLSLEVRARLPQGFELARADIEPGPVSPYVFRAARGAVKTILTGFVPDEASRDRLVDGARRRFFDSIVEDQLVTANGAPEKFIPAAEAGLAALARLAEGALEIAGQDVSLSGAARLEAARADIPQALENRLPKGFNADLRLTAQALGAPMDADGCRATFADLSRTPIVFDADDAISEVSAPAIDALTATVLRCRSVPIEVAGHTDNQGDAELNRDRAKRRARAVVEKFLNAGADSFHVWATGYGGDRPIASNDTEEGRARNRRIGFVVK